MTSQFVAVVCRDCGAHGYETPDDPAPDLCPPCFERRMDAATAKLQGVMSDEAVLALLIEAGHTERTAQDFINLLRLAEEGDE